MKAGKVYLITNTNESGFGFESVLNTSFEKI